MTLELRRLDGRGWTLVVASRGGATPEIVYLGDRLPAREDLGALVAASQRPTSSGGRDVAPQLSVCPEVARAFDGYPGLVASNAQGRALQPRFEGRFDDAPDPLSAIGWRGADGDLAYELEVRALAGGALAMASRLENNGSGAVRVDWLSAPAVPAPAYADHLIEYSGRWCGEFRETHVPWAPGARLREAREGRPGHAHFPGAYLPERGTTHESGGVLALHLAWSGGHRMVAEQLPDGRRLVQFGAMPAEGGTRLAAGATLATPMLYVARSDIGRNGAAQAMHSAVRAMLPDDSRPRPVHYNTWEAVYFRHDPDELCEIATAAARLGAERFVLDDGWFDQRHGDSSALGDWRVDVAKYPAGLTPLVTHVESLGMRFGLWIEPEMVNPDSALYREHPDWVLGPADQPLGRQQLVLDLSLEAVSAYLFDAIDALLGTHRIDYLKWDHNRALPFPDPAQTHALYALLGRLRAAHPHVEIETCASGGARPDFGMLRYCRRIWLSDSNDALERTRIHSGALAFLPPEVCGSHVGPHISHTSGRRLTMEFRAWVAASRHMGFECDPRNIDADQAEILTDVVTWWKANREWLHTANWHRLPCSDDTRIGEMAVRLGGERFVVFIACIDTVPGTPQPLRLTGLEATRRYRVSLRAPRMVPQILNRDGHALVQPLVLSGAALTSGALRPPGLHPATMLVLEGAIA